MIKRSKRKLFQIQTSHFWAKPKKVFFLREDLCNFQPGKHHSRQSPHRTQLCKHTEPHRVLLCPSVMKSSCSTKDPLLHPIRRKSALQFCLFCRIVPQQRPATGKPRPSPCCSSLTENRKTWVCLIRQEKIIPTPLQSQSDQLHVTHGLLHCRLSMWSVLNLILYNTGDHARHIHVQNDLLTHMIKVIYESKVRRDEVVKNIKIDPRYV